VELLQAGLGDLSTSTIGLVGMGSIGRSVAERLLPFGSRLLYTARHSVDQTIEQQLALRYTSLDDLLASSTIVSLHVPLTDDTQALIGEAELAKMRAGALLVNTSRGEVLDEAALRRALVSGHLGGAGLDVLRDERPGGS
jgi:phosphoglycerate dehydrogenase-like enzyme